MADEQKPAPPVTIVSPFAAKAGQRKRKYRDPSFSPFYQPPSGPAERETRKEKKILELIDRVIDYPIPDRPRYQPRVGKKVKLDREKYKLLVILHRDIEKLMLAGLDGQLNKDNADTLIKYLKLVQELEKDEKKDEANLTDEQLAAIAGEQEKE